MRALPVERQPQIANPLSQFDHLALLRRSPLQVDHANAAQGRKPVERGLIIAQDFLEVTAGNAQVGAPVVTLWDGKKKVNSFTQKQTFITRVLRLCWTLDRRLVAALFDKR